ncbi:MAG: hypothetical protein K9M82_09130 [Deltaproteobacteria bacterium]|nr:hypothetical protein [Deltaproteobacteria bacterium]
MFRRLFETFAFFKTFILDIARFLVPVTLPIVLLETFVAYRVVEMEAAGLIHWLPFGINFLFRPVYTAGLIWLISGLAAGEERSFGECLAVGFRCWMDLLGVYIISTVIIFAGLLALVVPGLIFFARLALAEFCVVLEGMNPRDALVKSNRLARGFTGEIIGCTVVLSFLLIGVDIISSYMLARFSLQGLGTGVIVSMVFMVLSATLTILFYRFYDLSIKKQEE